MTVSACVHENKTFIRIGGPDREAFLQGLVTNDVRKLREGDVLYTWMLTPQGKYFFDGILIPMTDCWLWEVEAQRANLLLQRLKLYILRAQVTLSLEEGLSSLKIWSSSPEQVFDAFEMPAICGSMQTSPLGTAYVDPRVRELGLHVVVEHDKMEALQKRGAFQMVPVEEYEYFRLGWGVVESAAELIPEKSIPLECGAHDLQAINWEKGCYMGQELTARTRYRGLVRKRLFPFTLKASIDFKSPILVGDKEVGYWVAMVRDKAVGLLRLDALGEELTCQGAPVQVHRPYWMTFLEESDVNLLS